MCRRGGVSVAPAQGDGQTHSVREYPLVSTNATAKYDRKMTAGPRPSQYLEVADFLLFLASSVVI